MSDSETREFVLEVDAAGDTYREISNAPRPFATLMRTVLSGTGDRASWDDARLQLQEVYGVRIASTRTVFTKKD